MGKLGYTLNGFYIVDGSSGQFEAVFCQFKQPISGGKNIYIRYTAYVLFNLYIFIYDEL